VEERLLSFPFFSLQGGTQGVFDIHATSGELPITSLPEAETALRRLVSRGYRVAVAFEHKGDADRAEYVLSRAGGQAKSGAEIPSEPGISYIARGHRRHFLLPEIELALLTESQIFPKRRRAPAERRLVVGAELSSFRDLRKGDYVVHEDHGIGRFEGMSTKTVAGITRDYLDIAFRDGDMLYIPHDHIQKVGRYVGAGGATPSLSKLGGRAWSQIKSRARKAVRELAGELLQLYALRKTAKGHVFSEDGEWQRRFEQAFPYQETEDQLRAVDSVKDDMESTLPMDRLVCGDVGYGKTEVALRAVFKSVMDSRQVMVLVPTTILAQQHYGTFRERFNEFPVKVEMLSRFRTPAEQRAIVADFGDGKVDVLIGTHRLLSRDISPKSLGLVVIDEEQRFGVAQKEALRRLKLKADVLALTATPIPRTLQMSLSGVRDISVIETPPRDRHPVQTYVGYYDEGMVRRAVEREVDRGGQVFYLHNRVDTIQKAAVRLAEIVPRVRIGIAHGQMGEHELEEVMLAFLRGDYDVLVTTTIIESGLDIPNANTLIVERADLLGLSQLYQIRGRIGRSSRVAHAFLFHPDEEGLTEEARARLSTLSDYTELGSGFKIAMRDLEIRGAGNLLGDEQSGHIAALGFEMYLSILQETVEAMQGEEARPETLPRIDIGLSAYVPSDFVPYEAAKVDLHRRIAGARAASELAELREELKDRFGPVPEAVDNLIFLSEVRLKLQQLGAVGLSAQRQKITVDGISLPKGSRELLRVQDRLYDYLAASGRLTYTYRGEGRDVRKVAARVLDDILGLQFAVQEAPETGRHA
jgi:transcription-repair coupling factor (superfamily II helicase)